MRKIYCLIAIGMALGVCNPALAADFKQFPKDMRVCSQNDMDGLFKLREVFEKPKSGVATGEFHQAPHQYLFFRKTQSYLEVTGSRVFLDNKSMNDELEKHQENDKRQYVLAESGALYFYKDTHPIASYTCEIMNKNEPPYYEIGEMLLIAYGPNNTLTMRVYHALHLPLVAAPPPHNRGR